MLSKQATREGVGIDGEAETGAELQPDRYYLLSDAGSFFFEPAGDNQGFESPEAAAEWARTQTIWPELDLSDGYAVAIVLGSEFNANQAAWDAWEGGEFLDSRLHCCHAVAQRPQHGTPAMAETPSYLGREPPP